MIEVTIECRNCEEDISFASAFEPNKGTEIADTQQHISTQFPVPCGRCLVRDWEVIRVENIPYLGVVYEVPSNNPLQK